MCSMVAAVAVACFLLVGLFIGVARFLFLHLYRFETRAAEAAAADAAAAADKEVDGAMKHLQRVTPVIVIQPDQEVHLSKLSHVAPFRSHRLSLVCMQHKGSSLQHAPRHESFGRLPVAWPHCLMAKYSCLSEYISLYKRCTVFCVEYIKVIYKSGETILLG